MVRRSPSARLTSGAKPYTATELVNTTVRMPSAVQAAHTCFVIERLWRYVVAVLRGKVNDGAASTKHVNERLHELAPVRLARNSFFSRHNSAHHSGSKVRVRDAFNRRRILTGQNASISPAQRYLIRSLLMQNAMCLRWKASFPSGKSGKRARRALESCVFGGRFPSDL